MTENDAELIERANRMLRELKNYPVMAILLGSFAERLEQLTTPEPWQTSPPPLDGLQFVRIQAADSSQRVAEGWYCHEAGWRTARSNWPLLLPGESVTGWREIVRPAP